MRPQLVPVVQAWTSDPAVGVHLDYSSLDVDVLADTGPASWRSIGAWSSCSSSSGYTADQPWELRAGTLTVQLVDGPDPTVSPMLVAGTLLRLALVPSDVWSTDSSVMRTLMWSGKVQRATTTTTKAGRRLTTVTAVDVVAEMQRGERVTRWVALHGTDATAVHHINALRAFVDPSSSDLPAAIYADYGHLDSADHIADPSNPLDAPIAAYWQQLTPAAHMDVLAASTGRRWRPVVDPSSPPVFDLMPAAGAVVGHYGDDVASRLIDVTQTLDTSAVVNEVGVTKYLHATSVDTAAEQASTYTVDGSIAALGTRHADLTVALVDDTDVARVAQAAMNTAPALTITAIGVDDYAANPRSLGDVITVTRAGNVVTAQIIGIDHDVHPTTDYAGVDIATTYHLEGITR